ncbi:hypothetical protein Tco_0442074 [Tanacetum coccineum]
MAASVELEFIRSSSVYSSSLFDDSLMNLLKVFPKISLRSWNEGRIWPFSFDSTLERFALYHLSLKRSTQIACSKAFLEYSAISWMAVLASATVLVGTTPLESRICHVRTSKPFIEEILRRISVKIVLRETSSRVSLKLSHVIDKGVSSVLLSC